MRRCPMAGGRIEEESYGDENTEDEPPLRGDQVESPFPIPIPTAQPPTPSSPV